MSRNLLSFTVEGHPEPAGSKSAFVRGGVARVVDANPKAKGWKKTVADEARLVMRESGWETLEVACWLGVTFYVQRPKSHLKGDGTLTAEGLRHPFPARKPDTLKLARAVEDALTDAGAYKDDALIVSERLIKQWGDVERADITLMALGDLPNG